MPSLAAEQYDGFFRQNLRMPHSAVRTDKAITTKEMEIGKLSGNSIPGRR